MVPFQPVRVRDKLVKSWQSTRTENSSTDICGGTMQFDSSAGGPPRGQRVLLTQRTALHAYTPQGKPRRRRCYPSKWHRRDKSRIRDIAVVAQRGLLKVLRTSVTPFGQKMYRQSLGRNPAFSLVSLLVRPWGYRVAPAAGEPYGGHTRPTP